MSRKLVGHRILRKYDMEEMLNDVFLLLNFIHPAGTTLNILLESQNILCAVLA